MPAISLDLASLAAAYAAGDLTPSALAGQLAPAFAAPDSEGIWIHPVGRDQLLAAAAALEQRRSAGATLPLYGVPFAVKDNIDVEGLPTTAACPAFAYRAAASAPVVQRLLDAGGLCVGKTNLDQFATGLVGVRSPYGVPRNPFDPRYIVGGSSSGSAAAVARGLASFALGTDTAGSGRVPAGFTNIVGLKPSPGLLSTRGVVPACRSLDCVSIFALTSEDALAVAGLSAGYDPGDPYARPEGAALRWERPAAPVTFRCGVPLPRQREFYGDRAAEAAFAAALGRLTAMGAELVAIDFAPFFETAALLYEGPWIAERLCELEDFVAQNPEALLPVTREILLEGAGFRGPGVFTGLHRLAALRQMVRPLWSRLDLIAVPTAPTIYQIDEIAAEPRARNAHLGRYTNFANFLELAAHAVPNGWRGDGLPTGITLLGPWGSDARLAALAAAYHRRAGDTLGATGAPLPALPPAPAAAAGDTLKIAVVGAHLSGEPLNHQLGERRARLVRTCKTAAAYRLYALAGTMPAKPGLVRVAAGGAPVEVEVWDVPLATVGSFLAGVSSPLTLGKLELEDGERVTGFLCEAFAVAGAEDITAHGGWRGYRRAQARGA
jgi:allophanate hydrolase